MVTISRGDVVWADFGEPRGSNPAYRRPAVVIQANAYNNSKIATVIVAAITSNKKLARFPDNIFLPIGTASLNKDSVVNITQLFTLDRQYLDHPVGALPSYVMDQIISGIRSVLGL